MKAEQLSVFLENRAGRLAEVTHTLAEAGVNIRALSLADTSDFGILRLIVDDQEKAKSVLKEHSFTLVSVCLSKSQKEPAAIHRLLPHDPATGNGNALFCQFCNDHGKKHYP